MSGVGKYLFTPLAVSATLAMAASYIVSRTVSPLCCSRFLRPHFEREHFPRFLFWSGLVGGGIGALLWGVLFFVLPILPPAPPWLIVPLAWLTRGAAVAAAAGGAIVVIALLFWIAPAFDKLFGLLTAVYERALRFGLRWRLAVLGLVVAALVPAVWAFTDLGQELFPEVDSGEFTLHLRAPGGPRVEETERQVERIEKLLRGDPARGVPGLIPEEDLEMVLSNIGLSSRWSAIYSPNNGPHAAALRVQLRSGFAGRRTPTQVYVNRLRERLAEEFPGHTFFFETGGMVRRILNAGAVAPIEVQVHGRNEEDRRNLARQLTARLSRLPQVADAYMPQGMDLPQLVVHVDRAQASQQYGFTDLDVMRSVVTALMSSAQIAPNLWIDRGSGNHYLIGVQYPERAVVDIRTLEDIPVSAERNKPGSGNIRKLKEVARIERTQGPVEIFRHTGGPVSQLFLNVTDNDLAGTAAEVHRLTGELLLEYALENLPDDKRLLADIDDFTQKLEEYFQGNRPDRRGLLLKRYGVDPEALKRGLRVTVQGEVAAMRDSFRDMAFSLALAVLLVYLILAAQFASWLDPFIMIVAAPLGLIGVALTLWFTGDSLNIQSCMGVLMMIGISVSNSILLVEFANRQREEGLTPLEAIVSAARIRIRPILMTTLATIAGLLPMALHLRPGDEMNVPLARAVIGGLASSTLLTLFVVPLLYVFFERRRAVPVGQ
jgi:multidrug efflux pump subunit AcrB